jgi:hypothetical protein
MKDFETLPVGAGNAIKNAIMYLTDEQKWLNDHRWSRSSASDLEHQMWYSRCQASAQVLSALKATLQDD